MALAESVTLAFMVLLETLSPEERAVFLLREVVRPRVQRDRHDARHDAGELPPAVSPREAHIADRRPRYHDDLGRSVRWSAASSTPCATRQRRADQRARRGRRLLERRRRQGLRGAPADLRPRCRAAMFVGFWRVAPTLGVAPEDISMEIVDVNAEPAMVIRVAGQIDSVCALTIDGDLIGAIRVIRNPDKLQFIKRQLPGDRPILSTGPSGPVVTCEAQVFADRGSFGASACAPAAPSSFPRQLAHKRPRLPTARHPRPRHRRLNERHRTMRPGSTSACGPCTCASLLSRCVTTGRSVSPRTAISARHS